MLTPGLRRRFATAAWVLLLALLPWWLGLPLLLSLVALLLADVARLQPHAATFRSALRWGLPGVLFALLRWLGSDALGWTVTALAGLVGGTLLAGLESWLGRSPRRDPAETEAEPGASWSELALAPPPRAGTGIVELLPVHWQASSEPLPDPRGGQVRYATGGDGVGGFVFADGSRIEAAAGRCCLSPGGRWLALEHGSGVWLFDRDRQLRHRMRHWHLCGWHHEQPWLQHGEGEMPLSLQGALGHEFDD